MAFWLRGWVLEMCIVAVQVLHLEGLQVRGALVHCLDVDFTVPVLVPVGLLLHDVELDVVEEGAADGFSEHQRFSAEAGRGVLVERFSCYPEELVCVDSGVHHETDSDDVLEVGG